jgi:hypothetical protein
MVYLKGKDFIPTHQCHTTGIYSAVSSMHVTKLPSDAFPIQVCETCSAHEAAYIRFTKCPRIQQKPSSDPPTNFDDLLKSLDPWESSLPQHLDPKFSHKVIHQALCPAGDFLTDPGAQLVGEIQTRNDAADATNHHLGAPGVSDGSVNQDQGTFGWSLSKLDGTILIDCQGQTFGMHMDSYRAES